MQNLLCHFFFSYVKFLGMKKPLVRRSRTSEGRDSRSLYKKLWVAGKGQLISKCLFGIFNSPKKRTKNSTLLLWYLKSNCFCSFFGRIEDTKRTFRISQKKVQRFRHIFDIFLDFSEYMNFNQ